MNNSDIEKKIKKLTRKICCVKPAVVVSLPATGTIGQFVIFNSELYFWDGSSWVLAGNIVPPSSTTSLEGTIELATQGEVNTGTDTVRAITPDTLEDKTYGTFTGATITDNAVIKTILQELETAVETTASDTNPGIVELATISEIDTATDTSRTITPDGLAGSYAGTKELFIQIDSPTTALTTGDGQGWIIIPSSLNGMNLVNVIVGVYDKGITGTTDVIVRRRRAGSDVDMLSTAVTIGDEFFAEDGIINTANDDVSTGDMLLVDINAIHSGTAPNGSGVTLQFRLP